ncbi:DEAD/DEAH box helicase family protein [Candidatus Micrarchaeota archaeon]|nr:DEAD/DEAH box helicase family protein [Candidatus Micrarchaeota archaeon]
MLRIAPRDYQKRIYNSIINNGNTIVVLPTGLGKTLIALMIIDDNYQKGGKSIFLAPTRPLVEQHFSSILTKTDIPSQDVVMITGTIPSNKRKELWDRKVVISTPQTVANDIKKGIINFDYSVCIFDEVHRAIGKYAYTEIANIAKRNGALLIGLTASPGSDRKKIKEIMAHLGITNVEIGDKNDKDISPYLHQTKIRWISVELPDELKKVSNILRTMIKEKVAFFSSWGIKGNMFSKSYLVKLKDKLLKMTSSRKYLLLSQYAYLFNLIHLLELIETQGSTTGLKYIEKLKGRDSKAVKAMFNDKRFVEVINLLNSGVEHPKLSKLVALVKHEKGQIIIFSQYVSQIRLISKKLDDNDILNHIFIGQRKGFTQKKQKEIIERFRNKEFNVLVSSSVGEEGLDIPSVDTVIFFEPIPSAIRSIQRRGRAGRARAGQVIILMTKDTQDEVFYWSSYHKEKKMKKIMHSILDRKVIGQNKKLQVKRHKKGKNRNKKVKKDLQTRITDFQ